MWGRSLDREDPLEEKMATRSNGERSLVGYSPWDCRVGHNDLEHRWTDDPRIIYTEITECSEC